MIFTHVQVEAIAQLYPWELRREKTLLLASFSYTHISPPLNFYSSCPPSLFLPFYHRVPRSLVALTVMLRYHPVVYRLHPSSHFNKTRSPFIQSISNS